MTSKTKKIIKQIATEHGVTPEQVEADMREAIRAGMASTDPHAQALWKQIAPDGKEPSIEQFLEFVSGRVKSKMN
ncbi:MAG: hypothetical protein IJB60_09305 [Bacteroidaceae bacterium]|nr:hypothetical protein [Bacteroidaceae bacterium]MBQ3517697.1 hypothetical protein [Clostridia bacterium]